MDSGVIVNLTARFESVDECGNARCNRVNPHNGSGRYVGLYPVDFWYCSDGCQRIGERH